MRRTVRIGVTGLARAGKTAFLTSAAANLLAAGAGLPALPALSGKLPGRTLRVALAPSGAASLPRFDYAGKLAALAADPPRFPDPTGAVSVLALDVDIGWPGLASALPPRLLRLEFLDYPGEWLLDLPLLAQHFAEWSAATLRRLETGPAEGPSRSFRGFVAALPPGAPPDEILAQTGHDLYRDLLGTLRRDTGLSMLQPGRFLMAAPGDPPPWTAFFPLPGRSGLAGLLARRYDAYRDAVRRDLVSPSFGEVDLLVVLADVLTALHAGPAAFADASAALDAVASALRWQGALPAWLATLLPGFLLPARIGRVAFAATKSDHVADRQRGNLSALIATLTRLPERAAVPTAAFALASVRCTEDFVWTLEGRPVSAVRGRVLGDDRLARSYPGEVPDRPPEADFWAHPFLALPAFEPLRLPLAGRGGVPHVNLDALMAFLLEDFL